MITLYELGVNGILADEMGLGKTIQAIGFLAYLSFFRKIRGPHLIVCPKSVLSMWADRLGQWLPELKVCKLQAADQVQREHVLKTIIKPKNFDVLVTTYEGALMGRTTLEAINWETIFVDEAQRVKNAQSVLSQALQLFRARFRLLMTGTPIQNNLDELWAILYFVMPTVFNDVKLFKNYTQEEEGLREDPKAVTVTTGSHEGNDPIEIIDDSREGTNPELEGRGYGERLDRSGISDSQAGRSRGVTRRGGQVSDDLYAEGDRPRSSRRHPHSKSPDTKPLTRIKTLKQKAEEEASRQSGHRQATSTNVPPHQRVHSQSVLNPEASRSQVGGTSTRRGRPSTNKTQAERPDTILQAFGASADTKRNEEFIKKIQKILGPLILQRTKEDAQLNLPAKKELHIFCPMTELQMTGYKGILIKDFGMISEKGLNHISMQLRKMALHPYLFPDIEEAEEKKGTHCLVSSSGKMKVLDKLLVRLHGEHRVLLFSQFTSMLDLIEEYCQLNSLVYGRIDGSSSLEERDQTVSRFMEPDSPIFLMLVSTRAGGVGLNLQRADTVIIFDSDWNPQMDLQAIDRAHRIGQTKPVTIYRLISEYTIEEKILERQRIKLKWDKLCLAKGKVSCCNMFGKAIKKEDMLSMIYHGLAQVLKTRADSDDLGVEEMLARGSDKVGKMEDRIAQNLETNVDDDLYNLQARDISQYMFQGNDYTVEQRANYMALQRAAEEAMRNKIFKVKNERQFRAAKARNEILLDNVRSDFYKFRDNYEELMGLLQRFDRSVEEDERVVQLMSTGFKNWTRRDYSLVEAHIREFGKGNLEELAGNLNRPLPEVEKYMATFWSRINEVPSREELLRAVRELQELKGKSQQAEAELARKMKLFSRPEDIVLRQYEKSRRQKSGGLTRQKLSLWIAHKIGLGDQTALFDQIDQACEAAGLDTLGKMTRFQQTREFERLLALVDKLTDPEVERQRIEKLETERRAEEEARQREIEEAEAKERAKVEAKEKAEREKESRRQERETKRLEREREEQERKARRAALEEERAKKKAEKEEERLKREAEKAEKAALKAAEDQKKTKKRAQTSDKQGQSSKPVEQSKGTEQATSKPPSRENSQKPAEEKKSRSRPPRKTLKKPEPPKENDPTEKKEAKKAQKSSRKDPAEPAKAIDPVPSREGSRRTQRQGKVDPPK